jgi:hypothetical protein
MKAIEQGLARIECTYEEEFQRASKIIKRSRDMTKRMMEEGFIAEPPKTKARTILTLKPSSLPTRCGRRKPCTI